MDYLNLIKDRLNIEITIPFFRQNYRAYEPFAPNPKDRLAALNKLVLLGFNVRLRLDPIFAIDSGIQTKDDIFNMLDRSAGIEFVISKPLRLVTPKNQISESFFEEMKQFYEGGKKNGVEWRSRRFVYSTERCAEEMKILRDECLRRNIPLVHCMDTVLVNDYGNPIIDRKSK